MKTVLFFTAILFSAFLQAQPGMLDTTFSEDGKLSVTMDGRGRATSVVIQPDSKIIVAGYSRENNGRNNFALARYLTDGQPDLTFSGDGKAYFDADNSNADDYCTAITLQPDGKIVAAGFTDIGNSFQFLVARFNVDGTLDTTFGSGGKTIISQGETSFCNSLAIQPNGKIILIGHSFSPIMGINEFVAMRFDTNGILDNSFGNGGVVTTSTGGGSTAANSIVIQPDGKIVLAGLASNSTTFRWDTVLVRYLANGVRDNTFGQNGMVVTEFPLLDSNTKSVSLQADGKFVVAGIAFTGQSDKRILLSRYTTSGTLDPSFGDGGIVITPAGLVNPTVTSMIIQDSKIIVGGSFAEGNVEHSFLACFKTNGDLDPDFGTNGVTVTSFGEYDGIYGLTKQPDGKIVTAGVVFTGNDQEFTVARYNTELSLGLDEKPDQLYGLVVYPNPLSQHSNIRFTLEQTADVSAEIYDTLGRKIQSIANTTMDAGTYEIPLKFVEELPNGIYHLVFSVGSGRTSLKLQK